MPLVAYETALLDIERSIISVSAACIIQQLANFVKEYDAEFLVKHLSQRQFLHKLLLVHQLFSPLENELLHS